MFISTSLHPLLIVSFHESEPVNWFLLLFQFRRIIEMIIKRWWFSCL